MIFGYVRTNGHSQIESIGGASVPNASSRFKDFIAGQMISSPNADEAVVTETFARDFGYEKPADAIGKTIEFLATPKDPAKSSNNRDQKRSRQTFSVCHWKTDFTDEGERTGSEDISHCRCSEPEVKEGAGQGGLRGLFPGARIYIPLPAARQWAHRASRSNEPGGAGAGASKRKIGDVGN